MMSLGIDQNRHVARSILQEAVLRAVQRGDSLEVVYPLFVVCLPGDRCLFAIRAVRQGPEYEHTFVVRGSSRQGSGSGAKWY